MTPKDVLNLAKEKGAKIVDFKFIDLPGPWQHFTLPVSEFDESTVRGGTRLRRLVDPRLPGDRRVATCCSSPIPATAIMDPFMPRCRRWS